MAGDEAGGGADGDPGGPGDHPVPVRGGGRGGARRRLAASYREGLAGIEGLRLPPSRPGDDASDDATVRFPRVYAECKDALQAGQCVLIKGKVSKRNDEQSLLLDKVKKLG